LLALLEAHHILHVSRIRVNIYVRQQHKFKNGICNSCKYLQSATGNVSFGNATVRTVFTENKLQTSFCNSVSLKLKSENSNDAKIIAIE
jgi:hypothetical protein